MAVLNPDHLFDQAAKLAMSPAAGPSRQVDLRRAVSAAYYGLFHFTLTALADEFVGAGQRASARYVLVYRSIDHRTLKEVCTEVQRKNPSQRYRPYALPDGFGEPIQAFAEAAIELQERRHRADYNPEPRFSTSDVQVAIGSARSAIRQFLLAASERKKTFLTLLLCPPR